MILFCLLISVLPLVVHPFWGKVVGGFTVMKYLGGLCMLYAALDLVREGKVPKYLETPQVRWFCLFACLAMLSFLILGSTATLESNIFVIYLSELMMLFITVSLTSSLPRLQWVVLSGIGSVAFGALYVVREWQLYHNIYPGFRPGVMTGDPNYFCESALTFLPLSVYLILENGPAWRRAFVIGCTVVTLTAFMLAASRGGFLGLTAATLLIIVRTRKPVKNLAMAAAVLIPMTLLAPVSPLERLLHPDHSDEESTQNREIVWRAGLEMIATHPLIGVGAGNFKAMVPMYVKDGRLYVSMAHNTYLEMLAELGFPGMFLFIAILVSTWMNLEKTRRRTAEHGPTLVYQTARGLQAGLLGCCVQIFTLSGQYQKLFWFIIFVSATLPTLAQIGTPAVKRRTRATVEIRHKARALAAR